MLKMIMAATFAGFVLAEPAHAESISDRNKQIVLEVFEALGSEDLEALNRHFSGDGRSIIGLVERPRGGPHETFDEAAPFPGAMTDVSVEVEHILAEGDLVAVQSKICGDHAKPLLGFAPTGKRLCARYLNLYALKDGVIVSNSVGVHRDQLRDQLRENAAAGAEE